MGKADQRSRKSGVNRRKFLQAAVGGGVAVAAVMGGKWWLNRRASGPATVILKAEAYSADLKTTLLKGLAELDVTEAEIRGRRVLLKPNLIEPHRGIGHINTDPLLVRAAIESFLHLGAASVVVAEGAANRLDALWTLEEAGYVEVLKTDRIPFVDLNTAPVAALKNAGNLTGFSHFLVPIPVLKSDFFVSMPKMKTHHWAGVTLSMKNLFGIMPGSHYGWPKNPLHVAGIGESILDINTTVLPDLAIVDGIVGMEGDGPIMGEPVQAGVVVLGRNLCATDATGCRVMGVDPARIPYLYHAERLSLGPVQAAGIEQRGETVAAVRKNFRLIDAIPAQRGIRLAG